MRLRVVVDGPMECACCGDERVVVSAWGVGYCVDCHGAGCDEKTCRATVETVRERVMAEEPA